MDNLETSNFDGYQISKYNFEGKVCYIGLDIAKVFGYTNPSKSIQRCIKSRKLQEKIDYDILIGARLKAFKEMFTLQTGKTISNFSRVIMLYEKGLYEFMLYSHKECAKIFQEWFVKNLNKQKIKVDRELKDTNKLKVQVENNESEKRIQSKKILFDTVQLIQNLHLLEDDSKIIYSTIEELLNISKYIIDKLGNE